MTYRAVLFIIRQMPSFIRIIAEKLKKVFSLRDVEAGQDTPGFTEGYEIVAPVRFIERRNAMKRKAEKRRGRLRYMQNPVEKNQRMYVCLLSMFASRGIRIDPGDTTMDITRKACLAEGACKGLETFAAIYNKVRYGNVVPDEKL